MIIQIMIGGIKFRLDLDFEVLIEESLSPFLCFNEKFFDVEVKVIYSEEKVNKTQMQKCGEDLLLEYYRQNEQMVCLAKASAGKYLSMTTCDKEFRKLECRLYFEPVGAMKSLENLLRLLPMNMILQKKEVLFLHASQVKVNGKGIVFTAPSGTGKTTQAKLWQKYQGAQIICNDRTLIREGKTYGYPIDGSSPVRSGEVLPLGAVVLLEQGQKDCIQRLSLKEAWRKLFPLIVITSWGEDAKVLAIEQVISMAEDYPVYLLRCTKEESAVHCLEQQLKLDGVI